jgi:hypothetical protein
LNTAAPFGLRPNLLVCDRAMAAEHLLRPPSRESAARSSSSFKNLELQRRTAVPVCARAARC